MKPIIDRILRAVLNRAFGYYCHSAGLYAPHCYMEEKQQCEACKDCENLYKS